MPKPRSLRSLAITTNVPKHSAPTIGNGPPSPTFSEATNASAINFGENGPAKIITRMDLKAGMQAYENLLNCCANYRATLMTMSRVTAAFADAMETCAGLKGPTYEQAARLQAAGGLHFLIGNHWHVLADTLDKNFEKPLRQHLDTYRTIVNDRSASYERALREKSNIIRDTEKRNMNRKERNLQSFREALNVLQRQVDELDDLKGQHYQEIIEHEEEVWDVVQGKACVVVRSTLDVFDRFTAKASDPVIEPMLQSVPDPFDSYGQPSSDDQIFSILPPFSIMANVPSTSPSSIAGTPITEPADVFSSTSTSWSQRTTDMNSDWADATSPSSSPPPVPSTSTSPRPTSPLQKPPRPSSPNGGRRTESKLRSVLSVIDEASAAGRTVVNAVADNSGAGDSGNGAGATSGSSGAERGSGVSWATFPFGTESHSQASSQQDHDTTPRNSTFYDIDLPPPEMIPERNRSPQSDETAIPA